MLLPRHDETSYTYERKLSIPNDKAMPEKFRYFISRAETIAKKISRQTGKYHRLHQKTLVEVVDNLLFVVQDNMNTNRQNEDSQ